jgi:hypothetical protein
MISKPAISYDIREARELLANGAPHEAAKQLGRIMENLELLLNPSGGRKTTGASAADEFGRANVEALRVFCDHAIAAVARGDNDRALTVLNDAQRYWHALLTAPDGN